MADSELIERIGDGLLIRNRRRIADVEPCESRLVTNFFRILLYLFDLPWPSNYFDHALVVLHADRLPSTTQGGESLVSTGHVSEVGFFILSLHH